MGEEGRPARDNRAGLDDFNRGAGTDLLRGFNIGGDGFANAADFYEVLWVGGEDSRNATETG